MSADHQTLEPAPRLPVTVGAASQVVADPTDGRAAMAARIAAAASTAEERAGAGDVAEEPRLDIALLPSALSPGVDRQDRERLE